MKSRTALIILGIVCVVGLSRPADAQLRWPSPQKKSMRIRLVAVALTIPRSSYFSTREVFVAETEVGHEEWSLVKLVFTFLPYQPGLLDTGFDYSVVHELSASRNPNCDETVDQLTQRSPANRHEPLVYSLHVPREDLDRRRIPLPCYEANADEYIRSSVEPSGVAEPIPFLDERAVPQPIPFLDERSIPRPIPSFDDRSKQK